MTESSFKNSAIGNPTPFYLFKTFKLEKNSIYAENVGV